MFSVVVNNTKAPMIALIILVAGCSTEKATEIRASCSRGYATPWMMKDVWLSPYQIDIDDGTLSYVIKDGEKRVYYKIKEGETCHKESRVAAKG